MALGNMLWRRAARSGHHEADFCPGRGGKYCEKFTAFSDGHDLAVGNPTGDKRKIAARLADGDRRHCELRLDRRGVSVNGGSVVFAPMGFFKSYPGLSSGGSTLSRSPIRQAGRDERLALVCVW